MDTDTLYKTIIKHLWLFLTKKMLHAGFGYIWMKQQISPVVDERPYQCDVCKHIEVV